MDYLVRFVQMHESFRKAEIQAMADLYGINLEFLHYSQYVRYYYSPFSRLPFAISNIVFLLPIDYNDIMN